MYRVKDSGMKRATEIVLPGEGTLKEKLCRMSENPPARFKGTTEQTEGSRHATRAPDALEVCERCGGFVHDDFPDGGRVCRCDGPLRRCRELVEIADPTGKMTFANLTSADASLVEAVRIGRDIASASGDPGKEPGLMMFGRPGVGKTHVAVAICREAIDERVAAGFYNVAEIVGRVQDTYGGGEPGAASRTDILASIASRKIVVLDDLGKEHQSSNVDSIIYELVNRIYSGGRKLVICTNLTPEMFRGRYDEAVISRIAAMCRAIRVEGEDRRRA